MVICVVAAENDDSAEVDKNAANESNQRRKVLDDIRITLAARRAFRPIDMLNLRELRLIRTCNLLTRDRR